MFPACTITIIIPNETETVSFTDLFARESIASIRPMLCLHPLTACLTNYSFTTVDDKVLSDFAEICTMLPIPASTAEEDLALSLTLKLKLDQYNCKAAKDQVQRLRDLVESSAPHSRAVADKAVDSNSLSTVSVSDDADLSQLIPNTLLAFADAPSTENDVDNNGHSVLTLSDVIKGVAFSGYNPPPQKRRLSGDLFYIEVSTTSDGIVFISATANGFFVNKSTRNHFDFSPQLNPAFAHDLMKTLCLHSSKIRDAWKHFVDKPPTPVPSQLGGLVNVFKSGNLDKFISSMNPSWVECTPESADKVGHSYNIHRAMETYADNYGIVEKGPLRDWNDETQAVRFIEDRPEAERMQLTKYMHKTIEEFYTASRLAVMEIIDGGNIAPMNINDPPHLQVYIYNNLFISKAAESADTFKLCKGEIAIRKYAAHDSKNLAVIESLNIPDLCLVRNCVMDYRGQRLVVQSILPGIIQSNTMGARLMLGALELGSRLKSKTPAYAIMKQIAEKVGIAERRVIASPIPSAISPELELEVVEDVDESALSAGELAVREHKMTVNQVRESEAALQDPSNKDANPQTIVLDDDDEEEGAAEDTHVRVAGAIEAKVLRGTDSRMYLLEAVRLTPRDANYVSATKGGSSKLPEDFLTKANAEGLCTAYLLRKELMQSFALHKTDLMRQRLVMEAVQSISAEKKLLPPVAPKDAVISLEAEDAGKDGKDGTIVNTTTPAATDITEAEINSKFHELLSRPENADVVVQATVPMNVNCFQDIECADDPATVHADEAHVRELSVYLFDILLPSLVEKVRTGHLDVLDGAQLTAALHTSGVNMRYLGRLAMLSREQELVDVDYSTRQSRRVRGMPFFLLELLETEMVARAFKVLLDTFCRLYDDVRSAPTRTIASMLNAVLGGEAEVPLESAPVSEVIGAKSKSKKHKTDLPQPFDAAANRQQFLNELEEVIYSRFNYKVILLHSTTEGRSGPLSRPTLLRRICQLAGVQVACRKYTFHSTPDSLVPSPIDVSDILALQPRLKGLKPYEIQPSRDITTLVEASRIMLNNNQLAEAFETAQAASLWCSQTLGPAHRDFSAILDTLTNAYVRIGDWSNAIAHCERNVMVLTQASGPDCAELVPKHHMLGILKAQSGLFEEAVKHMNAVKYLASLLGGPRHPMVTGALMQLGRMYKSMDMMPEAMMHYFEAQHTLHSGGCCDQNMLADLLADIAEVMSLQGNFQKAIDLQKGSFRIIRQMFSDPQNEQHSTKKKVLEQYIRAQAEAKLNIPPPVVLSNTTEVSVTPEVKTEKAVPAAAPREETSLVETNEEPVAAKKKSKKGKK